MYGKWLVVALLVPAPVQAQDAPTAPATAPVRSTQGATRNAPPEVVLPSAPLPRIDVDSAGQMLTESAMQKKPAESATTAASTAPAVTTRTTTYDVPDQTPVNRSRHFRFVSLKAADSTSVTAPAASDRND